MSVDNIPEIYLDKDTKNPELFVYDFRMTNDVVKSKVNLSMNMFSFLQVGKKSVHFADTSVAVNKQQSLIIKKGNCLWTEILETENIYICKLLFFSEKKIITFLDKHSYYDDSNNNETSYFIIENDEYISIFLNSLSSLNKLSSNYIDKLLTIKFEELMLYLINKYQNDFILFLKSLISNRVSSFNNIIKKNVYSNLKIEEIAFLCNMSLSTFKRHFKNEYNTTPGKWFQDKRLLRAKKILETGNLKPSNIYLDFGYNNLSNFSIAFKNKFGINPKDINS